MLEEKVLWGVIVGSSLKKVYKFFNLSAQEFWKLYEFYEIQISSIFLKILGEGFLHLFYIARWGSTSSLILSILLMEEIRHQFASRYTYETPLQMEDNPCPFLEVEFSFDEPALQVQQFEEEKLGERCFSS